MRLKIVFLICLLTAMVACEKLALLTTAKKKAIPSDSQLAKTAQDRFWNTLHQGQYDQIIAAETLLMAAYLENPNDPTLASHLGFLHIWKITERQRVKGKDPNIVNEIILARKYFGDSVELQPEDARIQGFLGDSELIEGQIFNNKREEVRGYFRLKRAINMWPEFNYFTAGYPMSTLSYDTDQFKEALDWQWKTLDICAGTRVDRQNPDFSPFLSRETQTGPLRACWNSWIAPHNFEGFFLNMGDMLVKSGDPQTAIKIYNNAKLSKTYESWPFRKMLEERIQNAKNNIESFRKTDAPIMFNSGIGCMACHQEK